MNYNFISQLLDNGFDSDQLIALLMKNAPNLGSKIKKLLAGGWGSNEILSYINKDPESSRINLRNAKPATPEEMAALQAYKASRGADKSRDKQALEDLTKFTKGALKLGGAIAAPYVGGQALQAGMGAIESLMKPSNVESGPGIGQQIDQQARAPVEQAMQPTTDVSVNAPPNPTNPIPKVLISENLKPIIDRVRQSGNNPEQIEGYLLKFHPKEVKQFEKESGKPIRQSIEEYVKGNPEQIQALNEEDEPLEMKNDVGSNVLLPDGNIGKIESIKQGIAKVKVDGKDRHKKLDELIEAPLPEKDLADLYKDVLSGIEKHTGQQVSRNVYWAGYDPTTNELAFIPHHGSLYVYKDISPEEAEELTSYLTQRKTSGENYIGAWKAGTKSPIGAAMSELIQRLQKKTGKGKEYSGKYEKIYDALEFAKLAAKRKESEKRKV